MSVMFEGEKMKVTYVLLDVGMSRTSTTNADANVIVTKVLLGQLAHVLIEGS
jgi:hypothetical protein